MGGAIRLNGSVDTLTVNYDVYPSGVIVHVRGALTAAVAAIYEECVADALRSAPLQARVTVEVSGLEYCDFSSLGPLIMSFRRVRAGGGELVLVGAQGRFKALLERTGVNRIIPLG